MLNTFVFFLVLDDLKNGQKFIQQDVNEALFRPKTNNDKNLQEFFENLQKSIHDLADKTDLILNSPTSSVDTEKLIAEISPMIASQIKKTDDDFPEKIKEMFATTKYEYECIQKLVHQNTEGFKELKKISAHFFEGKIYFFEKFPSHFFPFSKLDFI